MSDAPSLLLVNQHYAPDLASTAQHLTDLAEHLAVEGFEVHVLCSRGHYLSGEMDVPAEETRNGVHVHRVRTTAFGRETTLGRIADYASFFLQVLWRLLKGPRYDAVVSLTTPPLLPVAMAVANLLRGQTYGIWSMDLHPEAEQAVGMIESDGPLGQLLQRLADWSYRQAAFTVDLGPYMKARIRSKGVSEKRLHTIPVWNKKNEVYPIPEEENPLVDEVGLEDKFVVMYSGNAGIGHRFDEVLRAAAHFDGRNEDIHFLFVGSGPRREEIESFAERQSLSNLTYLDYFPRDQIKYSLSLADVHLLTLRRSFAGIAVPGKLYGILAAGRPVLMVGPEASDSATTIQRHEVGRVVDPGEYNGNGAATDAVVETIRTLYENPDRRDVLGERGREVFLERFEQERCCDQWAALLRQEVGTA
ncbi:glycosyltransferase involved in cell wall biosynthesis [Salinibacter ruber]|uniref:glycosyltransferase family 4 protein n=1 Tax=Salinibacter ruber TaxID=146919 RepID=UPI002169C799|nr:glycosyltransferase family 4 protein [Salinibacter ruber]MCS3632480.1 glycosyltransferase involved in cell wall biosynthesis [Salinibacter ruber]